MIDAFKEKTIWCFWTGNNPMSKERAGCLHVLSENSGAEVQLVNPKNLKDYEVEGDPFHEGYEYLSLTHKSDYLRSYFMYHYGGGYSDIKDYEFDWMPYWGLLEESDKDFIGAPELHRDHIASSDPFVVREFENLATVRYFIFKRKTEFAKLWKEATEKKMDEILYQLKIQDGSYHPRAVSGGNIFDPQGDERSWPDGYPLAWNDLLGQIVHQLQYENLDRFLVEIPNVLIWEKYR